jgi:hypothetical protein
VAATDPLGAAQEKAATKCRAEETASGSDRTVSGLRFSRAWLRMGILMQSYHRDAKWIARWFKQVNNNASKSKLQTRTVGRPLSGSQTAAVMAVTPPPTQNIDGKSGNLTEQTSSGTGTSPSLFRAASEPTYLFSRSGVQVGPENRRSATCHVGPYHSRLQSSGWELVHPAVAPDLQANREHELERLSFYPHSHGANQSVLSQPPCQSHSDHLVEHSQLTATLGILASSPIYLTSQAQAPFRHGTSSPTPNAGTGMDDVKSCNPHTSPASASAYTELELGYSQPDLGPGPGATAVETPARVGTHLLQAQAVPEFISPAESQLGPFESSAPPPSMYLLLFDTELDPVVDRERDERSSSSSGPLLSNDRMMEPHVTPTPISFLAKWEDMLTLERRIRSSSRNVKLLQSKRMQAVHAVEANRTKRVMGTGKNVSFCCPLRFSFFSFSCRELMYGQTRSRLL